jgi:hypothetical protein
MKKIIGLFIILVLLVSFFGCAANSSTGSITVINTTTTNCNSVKVGDVSIGYVGAGQTVTAYFYTAKNTAQVTADGFSVSSGNNGTIDLKLNYTYQLYLRNTTTSGKYYVITGYSIANGDDTISMK